MHHDIKQYMLSTNTSRDCSTISTKYKYDEAESRKLVLTNLVEDSCPFDTVEKRGIRKMAKRFNPQFKPFNRHTVRRELFKMYKRERENVKYFILNAPKRVAMTINIWKNDSTNEEDICVTVHFVDSSWQLQKRILRFRTLVPPYDATCISDEIILFLQQ